MKHFFIMVSIVLCNLGFSQNKIHLFGGVNLSKLVQRNLSESKYVFGYKIGFDCEISIFSKSSFIIELSSLNKGGMINNAINPTIGNEKYKEVINIFSVELPIKYKFNIKQFFVFAGAGIEYSFNSNTKFYNTENILISNTDNERAFYTHFLIGGGVQFSKYIDNIYVSITRSNGLINYEPLWYELRNYYFSLILSIKLNKTKNNEDKNIDNTNLNE